jgi:hypothetical protein
LIATLCIVIIFFPYNILDGLSLWNFTISIPSYHELGDFVGGISTPVLSSLALFLLFLTYKSQKTELRETRSILRIQTSTLRKQQFETTFFNMLSMHNSIVSSIDILKLSRDRISRFDVEGGKGTRIVYGRDCFKLFYRGLENIYKREVKSKHATVDRIVEASYLQYFNSHQSDLGHYFRNLYHIFKFINMSEVEDKEFYVAIVRAQLSTYESLMLFYNCLSKHGKKFKPLIEEFNVFKGLPSDMLLNQEHYSMYREIAYNKA